MATIKIRNIPDETIKSLQTQATQSGVSLNTYICQILEEEINKKEDKKINILELAEKYFGSKNGIDLELPARTSKRLPVDFE